MTEDKKLEIDKESAFIIAMNGAFFAAAVYDGKWVESIVLASVATTAFISIEWRVEDRLPSLIDYLETNYLSDL